MKKKIVHLCLYGPVMDDWSYQDNLLAKYHHKLGYDVTIICSKWIWNANNELQYYDKTYYKNQDEVLFIRLDNALGRNVLSKIKTYNGLINVIEKENPDILFIHDADYLDIIKIKKYLDKKKNIDLFIDNHNDFSNSGRNWFSKVILHKILWRYTNRILLPYAKKYYGVLPARVDFLTNVYGIPKDKTQLLVMGADDEYVNAATNEESIEKLRKEHNIRANDFLIVTGGKINAYRTEVINLIEAVKSIPDTKLKLIIFGSVSSELMGRFEKLVDDERIIYVGWKNSFDTYRYMAIANLVAFPGLHSVLWEQAVALGVPCIFRDINGFHHVDLNGNCCFFKDLTIEGLRNDIKELISDEQKIHEMQMLAKQKNNQMFLYSNIAKESISLEEE